MLLNRTAIYILVKFHQSNHKKLRYNLVCQKDQLVVDKSNVKSIIEYSVIPRNPAREIKLSSIFMNKICITILLNMKLFFCKSLINYFIDEVKSLFISNRMIMKDKEISKQKKITTFICTIILKKKINSSRSFDISFQKQHIRNENFPFEEARTSVLLIVISVS